MSCRLYVSSINFPNLAASAVLWAGIIGGGMLLFGCGGGGGQPDALRSPIVAEACQRFRSAEANPRVQLALGIATTGANLAGFGGPAAIVTELRAYGSRFCSEGPPAGDMTSEPQRASWLTTIAAGMVEAAIK
jgi:hypothetical protein